MSNHYYVYQHIEPDTKEAVYVGLGTYGRAWNFYGNARKPEHNKWMKALVAKGHHIGELVEILHTGLSRESGKWWEKKILSERSPKFNTFLVKTFLHKKFSKAQAKAALKLFEEDEVPYYLIPTEFGITSSNMSVLGKRMVEAGEQLRKSKACS